MITYIVVKYGDETELLRFLSGLMASGISVACADNDPVPSETLQSMSSAGLITYRHFPDNPGYYPSAFAAVPRDVSSDFVVIGNYDLDLRAEELTEFLRPYLGEVAVICPQVRDVASGRLMNPHMAFRPKAFGFDVRRTLFRNRYLWRGYLSLNVGRSKIRAIWQNDSRSAVKKTIFAPHGSIACFTRAAFEAVREFDPAEAVLYSEEVWLGLAAEDRGVKVVFDPALLIPHRAHSSTHRLPDEARRVRWVQAMDNCSRLLKSHPQDSRRNIEAAP